jgi:hypothetical protein
MLTSPPVPLDKYAPAAIVKPAPMPAVPPLMPADMTTLPDVRKEIETD